MYNRSKQGNTTPGWYAGSRVVRKISDGNPRLFIRIMNLLFEEARKHNLIPKAQHSVIYDFVKKDCDATKSLPIYGPQIHSILDSLAKQLKNKIHGDVMVFSGNSFQLKNNVISSNTDLNESIKLGIAYLKINVDDGSYLNNIDNDTKFILSNTYCAYYWIPMRKGGYPKLVLPQKQLHFKF